jgi:hypothetical protein
MYNHAVPLERVHVYRMNPSQLVTLGDLACETADSLINTAVPLYGVDSRDEPEVVGSTVVMQLSAGYYAATAGHVMRKLAPSAVYMATVSGLTEISDRGVTSAMSDDPSDPYLRDISVFPLPASVAEQLVSVEFVTAAQLDLEQEAADGVAYAFIGCPSSKNAPKRRGVARMVRLGLVGVPADHAAYEKIGTTPAQHLITNFVRSRQRRERAFDKSPDPHGMSGGAAWKLGSGLELAKSSTVPRLVGINIEHKAEMKVLVAIRIAFAVAALRTAYPETRADLPEVPHIHVTVST